MSRPRFYRKQFFDILLDKQTDTIERKRYETYEYIYSLPFSNIKLTLQAAGNKTLRDLISL